jgi:hypothetical protein
MPMSTPSPTTVTLLSGSTTETTSGGTPNGRSNPTWVTGSVYVLNQTAGGAASNVVANSGSVVGLLMGGQPVSTGNPVVVTGSVYVINPSGGGSGGNITSQSGSVTGLLMGGQPVAGANPLWVTGSVGLTNSPASTTVISGSVSGLLVGGQPNSQANPLPALHVSGSVTGLLVGGLGVSTANPVPVVQEGTVTVTGSIGFTQGIAITALPSVTVSNFPATQAITGSVGLTAAVTVANPQTTVTTVSGSVAGLLQGGQVVSTANPLPITGSVYIINPSGGAGGSVTAQSGSVTGLLMGGLPVSSGNPLWVTGSVYVLDPGGGAGGSVTVQSGSVTGLLVGGQPVSAADPVPVSQQGTVTVTGSVGFTQGVAVTNFPVTQNVASGSVVGLLIGGVPVNSTNWVPVQDVAGTLADETGVVRTVNRSFANATTSGNTQVVAAQGAGVRIRVIAVHVMTDTAMAIKFQSATSDISAGMVLAANGGYVKQENEHGWFQTAANAALNINLGVNGNVGVDVVWVQAT